MSQKKYLNALNLITNLGPQTIFHLLKTFNQDAAVVWHAPFSALRKSQLKPEVLEKIVSERTKINPEKEWEKLEKLKIETIPHPAIDSPLATAKPEHLDLKQPDSKQTTPAYNQYPKLLTQIPLPPPLLYIKGILDASFINRIAVVGSRQVSSYGRQVINDIVYHLALNKLVVVSGLALGADSLAHLACLKANTPTIGVLANGLDQIYPAVNYRLAQNILTQNGALISELPINTPPFKYNFPRRNRLISGLCQATLIIEATLKSGSLITAMHALEQNRDIFAVPGNIYNKNSAGTNNLIKQGAKLITQASDILWELNIPKITESITPPVSLSPIQQKIYSNLSKQPIYIDHIIKKLDFTVPEINTNLTLMEIKGIIKNLGGGYYVTI